MKLFLILLILLPQVVFSSTLHLSEILRKGYHFSSVRYAAFDEPETAKGKDTEEYLAIILKNAKENVDKNYVLVRELDLDISVFHSNSTESIVINDNLSNSFNLKDLKRCAQKSLPFLKAILFHQSLKQDDLKIQAESILANSRGIIDGHQIGIVCGMYMGKFGEVLRDSLVEEFKLASFLAKESDESILKILKVIDYQKKAGTFIEIKFLKYVKAAFFVSSFRGVDFSDFNLVNLRDKFRNTYLADSTRIIESGVVIQINQKDQRDELERIYLKVENEIN